MSETCSYCGPVAQVDEPHDPQTRDPEFVSQSERSFADIVKNRNSKKTKKVFEETNADPKQAGSGPEKNSDSEKMH
jgi:hypothetical protein